MGRTREIKVEGVDRADRLPFRNRDGAGQMPFEDLVEKGFEQVLK
jgi:hypothetical protein